MRVPIKSQGKKGYSSIPLVHQSSARDPREPGAEGDVGGEGVDRSTSLRALLAVAVVVVIALLAAGGAISPTARRVGRAYSRVASPSPPVLGCRRGSCRGRPIGVDVDGGPRVDGTEALAAARRTGIDIDVDEDDGSITWSGKRGGRIKKAGPLAKKKVGVLVASEFSDFQAYYLASYIGEMGGLCEFLLVDWATWKNTRPNLNGKGVRGMWDVSVDPIPTMAGSDKASYKGLLAADPLDYDAVVVLGGHSADVMVTEQRVIDFVQVAAQNNAVLGSIGEGSMVFVAAEILHGKRVAGNGLVDYMLEKIALLEDEPVVSDADDGLRLVTARDTIDTPAFLRSLCHAFDPGYEDIWKDSLAGRTVLFPIGEDFEDIELVVPVMEFLHRGANVVIGRFEPQFTSRPPHGSEFAVGNFGVTVPFQEIPKEYYSVQKLDDVKMRDFDVAVVVGAFNPWNMVATGRTDWLKEAHASGKTIAAICHGPIAAAKAGLVSGKKVTGWLASKDSVEIMGGEFGPGEWAAVIDGSLISGRTPPEIPEFVDAISVALLE